MKLFHTIVKIINFEYDVSATSPKSRMNRINSTEISNNQIRLHEKVSSRERTIFLLIKHFL